MKRTIEVTHHHHSRESSLSSLEIDNASSAADFVYSPASSQHSTPQRWSDDPLIPKTRRISGPDAALLACSSPEIRELCKTPQQPWSQQRKHASTPQGILWPPLPPLPASSQPCALISRQSRSVSQGGDAIEPNQQPHILSSPPAAIRYTHHHFESNASPGVLGQQSSSTPESVRSCLSLSDIPENNLFSPELKGGIFLPNHEVPLVGLQYTPESIRTCYSQGDIPLHPPDILHYPWTSTGVGGVAGMTATTTTASSSSISVRSLSPIDPVFCLEDIARSLSSIRLSTPDQRKLQKPSLHRRVSFDMLPSPEQIAAAIHATNSSISSNSSVASAPVDSSSSSSINPKSQRHHRRSTTVIV